MNDIAVQPTQVVVKKWAAWAPGLETPAAWRRWAKNEQAIDSGVNAPVDHLPKPLRRRLSPLTKMALKVAHDCSEGLAALPSVFCSQHGELGRSSLLLDQLANKEALSPTAFSMSVHNTAAGIHSIAQENSQASTSIAAGIDTFEMAFLSAASTLMAEDVDTLLLVAAEEPLPDHYSAYRELPEQSFALALALSLQSECEASRPISLSFSANPQDQYSKEQHGLAFLRFFLNQDASLDICSKRMVWHWQGEAA